MQQLHLTQMGPQLFRHMCKQHQYLTATGLFLGLSSRTSYFQPCFHHFQQLLLWYSHVLHQFLKRMGREASSCRVIGPTAHQPAVPSTCQLRSCLRTRITSIWYYRFCHFHTVICPWSCSLLTKHLQASKDFLA